jgi:hypothetical protein
MLTLSRDHRVHEPGFPLTVCGFPAHDYSGDGSFYLLDVPGVLYSIFSLAPPKKITSNLIKSSTQSDTSAV